MIKAWLLDEMFRFHRAALTVEGTPGRMGRRRLDCRGRRTASGACQRRSQMREWPDHHYLGSGSGCHVLQPLFPDHQGRSDQVFGIDAADRGSGRFQSRHRGEKRKSDLYGRSTVSLCSRRSGQWDLLSLCRDGRDGERAKVSNRKKSWRFRRPICWRPVSAKKVLTMENSARRPELRSTRTAISTSPIPTITRSKNSTRPENLWRGGAASRPPRKAISITRAVWRSGRTTLLYVADSGNNRVQKFDLDGNVMQAWGKFGFAWRGADMGKFDVPWGVDDGSRRQSVRFRYEQRPHSKVQSRRHASLEVGARRKLRRSVLFPARRGGRFCRQYLCGR